MRFDLAAAGLAAFLVLHPGEARAQEWFDDYARGVESLSRDKPETAIRYLERAVRKRPEPGSNLITYGTNRLAAYEPYLKLAEAYLETGSYEAASEALRRSESLGKEPAQRRAELVERLHAVQEKARASEEHAPDPELTAESHPPPPRAPAPSATAPPTPAVEPEPDPPGRRTGHLVVRSEPESGASVLANGRFLGTTPVAVELDPGEYEITLRKEGARPQRVSVRVEAGGTNVVDRTLLPAMPPRAPVEPPAAEQPKLPALLVVSRPPGASVYLDDELIGSTDPETGRLLRSEVLPGSHRIRLARAGFEELVDELEISAAGETLYEGVLSKPAAAGETSPAPAVSAPSIPRAARRVALGALAIFFAGLVLAVRRRHRSRRQDPSTLTVADLLTEAGDPEALETRPSTDPKRGERFGEFWLLERLGRGGMANVFLAERDGERCALKRPLPSLLQEREFRERFLREADIGRALHHPNIIRIFERGEVEGAPYFTMELVNGETLRDRLDRRELKDGRAASGVVLQIAEALDYAHLKGVIHRDLKPSNIMILEDGTVKVMDYGIARARRFGGLTHTGDFLGTPNYAAPEAAEGKPTDARSDLYALGVIFYEMLTGQRPFASDNPLVTLKKHCSEPPTPPSLIAPSVPRRLEMMILRLLSKSPDERYPDAEHLLVELRDYLNRP